MLKLLKEVHQVQAPLHDGDVTTYGVRQSTKVDRKPRVRGTTRKHTSSLDSDDHEGEDVDADVDSDDDDDDYESVDTAVISGKGRRAKKRTTSSRKALRGTEKQIKIARKKKR